MLKALFYFHFHDSLIPCFFITTEKMDILNYFTVFFYSSELRFIDHVGTIL